MIKKGFTILETVFSVTIFSVLMLIVFNAWTEFQRASVKNSGKHDTNIQFVNVYRNIDKYVSSSSTRLFKCYSDTGTYKNRRWFAFLVSRKDNKLDGDVYYDSPKIAIDYSGGGKKALPLRIIYNTVVVYLLNYKDGCCDGFNNCPHKSIRRYVYKSESDIYFGNIQNCNWGEIFEKELKGSVKDILSDPDSKPYSVIENDLVDMTIEKIGDEFKFILTILREKDAERHFKIGTRDLIDKVDNDTKKYIENLSWVSIPSNT